jgi:kelch-like protein 20
LTFFGIFFAVGGWCSGDAIASVERFDPNTLEWKMVASMSKRRCGVGVAVCADLLYAVGGHDGQSYLNSIERYDPQTNQWSCDVAPTTSCRTSVGVAVLDGEILTVEFYA